jgi:fatty-acyl-CoA synthase
VGPRQRPQTLPDILARAAEPGLGGWHFHLAGRVDTLPVAEVHARASRLAAGLAGAGFGGGLRVALVGLNSPEWVVWAWATWLSGAALVPLPAPLLVRDTLGAQLGALVEATEVSLVVGARTYLDVLGDTGCPRWEWTNEAPVAHAAEPTPPSPSDLAAILCTSGSTAAPKAVGMTHARAVEWAAHNAVEAGARATAAKVTWFPYYHVAGLGTLFELLNPVDEHVIPLRRFLADPLRWLRLVSETRAVYAVSPSSVWSAILDGLARDPSGVDLSHLHRLAFNAEMTDPDVLGRLRELCRPLGLRPGAIAVHYASSEAGMITRTPLDSEPRVEAIALTELVGAGRAVAAEPGVPAKRVVSCGEPYPGVEIRIGHPHDPLPERHEGEVWVRGPGVTDGYLNASGEGLLVEGWLRPGDLGYLADGELWVTGRSDEVVVVHGEKYHPEDIEWAVLRATGRQPGACAAFSAPDPGGFVVVVEDDGDAASDLEQTVRNAVVAAVGIPPSAVHVVAPGTIPTTPNGKLQRSALRRRWSNGTSGPDGG